MWSKYPIYEALENRLLLSVSTQLVDATSLTSQTVVTAQAVPTATATTLPSVSVTLKKQSLSSYGPSDGRSSISSAGGVLSISGNAWKKMALTYNITPYTVLEFDYKSTAKGAIQGIGFDGDNTPSWSRFFELQGATPWGIDQYTTYDASGGQWTHYKITVGEFFSGPMKYLTFVNAASGGTAANSWFKNVKIYDTASPTLSTPRQNIPLYALAQDGNIRGAFVTWPYMSVVPTLASMGVNTVFMPIEVWPDHIDPKYVQIAQDFYNSTHQNGMQDALGINLWSQESTVLTSLPDFQPYVDATGTVHSDMPDPTDPKFWTQYLYPRFAQLSQLKADAVWIDMEMYYASDTFRGASYSDGALTSFATAQNITISGSMSDFRKQVVADATLNQQFITFQTNQIATYARHIRDIVPANIPIGTIRGDFAFFYTRPIPFFDGMAIGLGTAERPVINFSESLYNGYAGYTGAYWHDFTRDSVKYFDNLGAHVINVFGLNQSVIGPTKMASYLFSYAHASGGSWIWNGNDYATNAPAPLPGTVSDYIAAAKAAFMEVQNFGTSSTYYDPLQLPLTGTGV